jgi:hypothetical protein
MLNPQEDGGVIFAIIVKEILRNRRNSKVEKFHLLGYNAT